MKITELINEVFEWKRPGIWNAGHFYGMGRLHKVTVHTDEGITGYGWNGGTAAERPLNLFPGYVDYFRPLLVGRDPMDTRSLSDDLGEKLIKILGIGGINTQVLAAINIACWDIKGKALGRSIHQMLGGAQQRIRTYIAGGYYAEGKGLEELPRRPSTTSEFACKKRCGSIQRRCTHRRSRSRLATPMWEWPATCAGSRPPARPLATMRRFW